MVQDSIFIHGLKTNALIGIQDWERQTRQTLILDLELRTDISAAARHDDITLAVDYKKVVDSVISLIESSSFGLIESLATALADLILENFKIQSVKLSLYKPNAILEARTVGVCIERSRSNSSES